jgi:hypothetical protein
MRYTTKTFFMKNKPYYFVFMLCFVLLCLLCVTDAEAQCAMCRSSVESNITNESSRVGLGLNKSILYLLSLPYLLIASLAYLWYRNSSWQKPKKFDFQWKKS